MNFKSLMVMLLCVFIMGCQRVPTYSIDLIDVPPEIQPDPGPRPAPTPRVEKIRTDIVHKPKNFNEYNALLNKASKQTNQPIYVNIGTTWCQYCKLMVPHINALVRAGKDVVVVKADVDKWPRADQEKIKKLGKITGFPVNFVKRPEEEKWKRLNGYLKYDQLLYFVSQTTERYSSVTITDSSERGYTVLPAVQK